MLSRFRTIEQIATAVKTLISNGPWSFNGSVVYPYSDVTISGGEISATGKCHILLTGEGDANDDLDTINNGTNGQILILAARRSTHDITIKDATGNVYLDGGADLLLERSATGSDYIQLIYSLADSIWCEIGRGESK